MEHNRISVGLFLSVLPHYRLPIFERLAQVEGIDLIVYYSREPSYYSLKTVNPENRFPSEKIRMKAFRLCGQELLFQPEISKFARSRGHDVVIVSGNPRLLSNLPLLYTAKRWNLGIVWWSLGLMPNRSSLTLAVRKVLMKIPDSLVFYTDLEKNYFVDSGIPAHKVFVAQNTIDVSDCLHEEAKWCPESVEGFRAVQGLKGKKVILYCARLMRWKRLDLLLRALAELGTNEPKYHLVVIGRGDGENDFKDLAEELKIQDAITWLGPIYEQAKLAPWFLIADVLVVPEVLGLTVFHSFAYGLPVITCDSYDHQSPESVAVRHGYNGLLYKQGNLGDLTACISRICKDDNLRSRLSDNAKQTILTEYTPDKMVDGFVQAIRYSYEMTHRA